MFISEVESTDISAHSVTEKSHETNIYFSKVQIPEESEKKYMIKYYYVVITPPCPPPQIHLLSTDPPVALESVKQLRLQANHAAAAGQRFRH